MQRPKIDKVIFWTALVVIVCFSVPLVLFPAEGKALLGRALSWSTKTLGWTYLWFTIGAFGTLVYFEMSGLAGLMRVRSFRCPVGWRCCSAPVSAQVSCIGALSNGHIIFPVLRLVSNQKARRRRSGPPRTGFFTGVLPLGQSTASRPCHWPISIGTGAARSCAFLRPVRV